MQTQNYIKELTEGMQDLCAVANRIVVQNGNTDPIEIDLLMEDLRRLYNVALKIGGNNLSIKQAPTEPADEPLPDQEILSSTMMATMAAMSVVTPVEPEPSAKFVPEPEPEPEPFPIPEPITEPESIPESEPESIPEPEPELFPESETISEPEPEPLPSMEPQPDPEQSAPVSEPTPEPVSMHSFETESSLLFDEVVVEPEPTPEPESEPEPAKPQQSSLLDYLKHPTEDRPTTRTLGESLLSPKNDTPLEKKVDDLRTVININDKFSFMSELFKNNMRAYNDFIMYLNGLTSREEALAYVAETADRYQWDNNSTAVQTFYKVFDKKF